jgi:hypothetical protein
MTMVAKTAALSMDSRLSIRIRLPITAREYRGFSKSSANNGKSDYID